MLRNILLMKHTGYNCKFNLMIKQLANALAYGDFNSP